MKALSVLLLCVFSFSASAATLETLADGTCPPGLDCGGKSETPFTTLQRLFETSQETTPVHATGWFAGRCYYPDERTLARAGVLTGFSKTTGSDQGPLFPGKEVFFILPLISGHSNGDYFDTLTSEKEREINSAINHYTPTIEPACSLEGSLSYKYKQGNRGDLRHTPNYMVLRLRSADGVDQGFCYYFKKLK